MKKQSRSKRLLVSVEKLRELQPDDLRSAAGGCGAASYDPKCCHTLAGGCGYSGGL